MKINNFTRFSFQSSKTVKHKASVTSQRVLVSSLKFLELNIQHLPQETQSKKGCGSTPSKSGTIETCCPIHPTIDTHRKEGRKKKKNRVANHHSFTFKTYILVSREKKFYAGKKKHEHLIFNLMLTHSGCQRAQQTIL